jgi:hypothetical protein
MIFINRAIILNTKFKIIDKISFILKNFLLSKSELKNINIFYS